MEDEIRIDAFVEDDRGPVSCLRVIRVVLMRSYLRKAMAERAPTIIKRMLQLIVNH